MSRKSYQEYACDRCKASERTGLDYMYQQTEPPLPMGWAAVVVGAHASRHLCPSCAKELCAWLGMAP